MNNQSKFYCFSTETWAPSQYKDLLSRYMDFHYEDKTVVRPSYHPNGNSQTGKAYLYKDEPLDFGSLLVCFSCEVLGIRKMVNLKGKVITQGNAFWDIGCLLPFIIFMTEIPYEVRAVRNWPSLGCHIDGENIVSFFRCYYFRSQLEWSNHTIQNAPARHRAIHERLK